MVYSSDPPTTPGTNHVRLTPTRNVPVLKVINGTSQNGLECFGVTFGRCFPRQLACSG